MAQSPVEGTCPVFPADNIWNTRIDHLPVSPNTAAWVNTIGATSPLHPDFGGLYWDGAPNGIPYIDVAGNQTKYPATFTYQDESDPGPYAIPLTVPIEGGPNGTGDRHAITVDTTHCILYELFSAYPVAKPPSWSAGSGIIMNLLSDALRLAGWTSGDAAGLPIFPGLVRYDEILQGEIRHAIRFTVPQSQRAYVWPARHFASYLTSNQYPPMGARFRLTASFDISSFSPINQIILTAMKRYGIIVADNGSSWFISGTPDPRWDDSDLHWLTTITGAQFEAVDSSPLMADPNSGRALTIPVSVTVSPASTGVRTGTTQQFTAAVTGSSNRAVTWDVNGVAGGNSTFGTISANGLYSAPSVLPSPITVTVHANSAAAPATGSGSVVVSTTNVAVLPSGATIAPLGTQQFTAQGSGGSNPSVTWYVNGIHGGNASIGTISPTGLYKAPNTVPANATVKITATHTSDSLGSGNVSLTISWP
jgi:hypothetical protein